MIPVKTVYNVIIPSHWKPYGRTLLKSIFIIFSIIIFTNFFNSSFALGGGGHFEIIVKPLKFFLILKSVLSVQMELPGRLSMLVFLLIVFFKHIQTRFYNYLVVVFHS